MPVILAIETSQHAGGVAMRDISANSDWRGGDDAHVEMLAAAKRHDDDLLPAIDRLFARVGLKPRDLAAVAVSIGPGGFTGLRIAVSTAKMFAETLSAKVIAVPSALVAAESVFPGTSLLNESSPSQASLKPTPQARGGESALGMTSSVKPVVVALASKGETCWCTRLQQTRRGWSIAGQPGIDDAATLDLHGVEVLIGDDHLPDAMRRRCENTGVKIVGPIFDPRACLTLAEPMRRDGLVTDPLALVPIYPRPPEAVAIWERRAEERAGR